MINSKISANNKVAIVTGSSIGLGYGLAVHLARNRFRTCLEMYTGDVWNSLLIRLRNIIFHDSSRLLHIHNWDPMLP